MKRAAVRLAAGGRLGVGGLLLVLMAAAGTPAAAGGGESAVQRQDWPFSGFLGRFDKAQLQRGFQVYKEVCANCHGLKRVAFRNLAEKGGPEFPLEAVKALAVEWPNKPLTLNDEGKWVERLPGLPDPILGPYRNDLEARAAQNGALPPDLSLIAKARGLPSEAAFYVHPFLMIRDIVTAYQEAGPDYLYALLTGYEETPLYRRTAGGKKLERLAPGISDPEAAACASVRRDEEGKKADECVELASGMVYNRAFPGHQIAMPPFLSKDSFVTYQDGSGSLEQNARDIAAFLAWAADPHHDARKDLGWQVLLYLAVMAVLIFLAKRRIWARAH